MTNFDAMLELEEKINNAAKECSDRLCNKKWDSKQDMSEASFIEGIKWLSRESMKEQVNRATSRGRAGIKAKALDTAVQLLKDLLANVPDTYSGTNIELTQQRMFKFACTVNSAQEFINEHI